MSILVERAKELLRGLAPTDDAHVFVNESEMHPRWSVGWIDNVEDPRNGFTRTGDDLTLLIRQLKKELRKQTQRHILNNR
jgi:hypothetical protein